MNIRQRESIALVILCAAAAVPNTTSAIGVSGQGTWEITLNGRDLDGDSATHEAYYDSILNITWLTNANASGYVTWNEAKAWVSTLELNGFSDWRLPATLPVNGTSFNYDYSYDGSTDRAYNISAPNSFYPGVTSSEMAHLFFVTLGNKAIYSIDGHAYQPGWGLTNTGPFSGMHSSFHWSDTPLPDDLNWGLDLAWGFDFGLGNQGDGVQTAYAYALAVHNGDIGASAVPLPGALWLFFSGTLSLIGLATRRKSYRKRSWCY